MWASFKALTLGAKLGILAGVLALFAILMGSSYYIGYSKGENISKVAIGNYETQLSDLRAKLATAQGRVDVKVVTEYKDRIQYVDRVVTETKTVIKDRVPEQFNLSKGWIYVYNQSVAGNGVEPSLAADANSSLVSDKTALLTITENNGVCLSNKEQLIALQTWIRDTEKAREEATK